MASIALPALHVNPPEQQPNALEQYARIMQLKQQQAMMPGQLQQQQQTLQAGAQENQMRQQQIADQKAMTDAMHEWDGKDMNSLPGLMLKHGASAQAVMTTKTGIIKQQQDFANLTKDQQAIQANKTNLLLGGLQAASQAPDDKLADSLSQTIQDHVQAGNLDPQHAQIGQQLVQGLQSGQITPELARKQLSLFEKSLMGTKEQQEQELKGAQSTEAANRSKESEAIANKTNLETEQLKQYGGLSPAAADAKYRFLQQRLAAKAEVSPDDQNWIKAYEKQKLLVPGTTANLKMEGMGKIRQFPVYDNQTKQTVYMDSNEINDAKLTQPGRFVVPQFSPEAITQQQTGKTFAPGGKGGEEALAFQTAMQHADLLKKAAQALNNGDVRTLNSLKNSLATEFGDADLTNFAAIKHVYENEVQKMIAGSHVTDAELKKNSASLPDNANFETTMKVLDSYKALAQSKLTLRQKQEQLGKQGQSMTSAQPEAPKGMIQARDPQGKLHQAPAGTPLPTGWKLEQ